MSNNGTYFFARGKVAGEFNSMDLFIHHIWRPKGILVQLVLQSITTKPKTEVYCRKMDDRRKNYFSMWRTAKFGCRRTSYHVVLGQVTLRKSIESTVAGRATLFLQVIQMVVIFSGQTWLRDSALLERSPSCLPVYQWSDGRNKFAMCFSCAE